MASLLIERLVNESFALFLSSSQSMIDADGPLDDLQVRFKWSENDVAIWDNRSVFHTATNDYYGKRSGNRVVSLGEKPFFDPNSRSRREALAAEQSLPRTEG